MAGNDDPDGKPAEKKTQSTTSDPKPTRQTLPPTSPRAVTTSEKGKQGPAKDLPKSTSPPTPRGRGRTYTSNFGRPRGPQQKMNLGTFGTPEKYPTDERKPIEPESPKPPPNRLNRPGFLGVRGSPSSRGARNRGGYTGRSYPFEYEPSEAGTETTDGLSYYDEAPNIRPQMPVPPTREKKNDSDTTDDETDSVGGKNLEDEGRTRERWGSPASPKSWRDTTDTESLASSEQNGGSRLTFGPPGFGGKFGPPGESGRGGPWGRGGSFRGDSGEESSRGGYRGRGFSFRGRGGFGESDSSSPRGGFRGRGFFDNPDSQRGRVGFGFYRGRRGDSGEDSFRGSFRGRGRGRGRGAPSLISEAGNPSSWRQDTGFHKNNWVFMPKNWKDRAPDGAEPEWVNQCGELVAEILLENLDSDEEEDGDGNETEESREGGNLIKYTIDPNDVESVASYTWVKPDPDDPNDIPTILVPGAPPIFQAPTTTLHMPPDSGEYLRDINHTRTPYPLEPAIRSLLTLRPNYPTADIDLVLCASTMSKLLWFSLSRSWNFRFNVELVGNTVFFQRNEGKRGEIIPDVMGYGHGFHDSTTSWSGRPGLLQSRGESHQRLVTYTFAGLRCMVRFESDGYLPSLLPPQPHRRKSTAPTSSDLLNLFDDLSLSPSGSPPTPPPIEIESPLLSTPTLRIFTSAPTPIPHAPLLDLKTRSCVRPIEMDEVLLRLWVNRTPNFVIAYHRVGTFEPEATEVMDVREAVREWEEKNRDCLVRLGKVLREVVGMVRESRGRRWEVRRVLGGGLQVRRPWEGKREGEEEEEELSVLPEVLKARWVDGF